MIGNTIGAVIEIGSDSIYFKIAQRNKYKIEELENIRVPLSIGKDTFSKGKIDFEKIDTLCETINNFLELAKDYEIKDIRAVATTALRDAENRDYILDQIKVKTGVNIEVIDDSEEKHLIYKEMLRELEEIPEIKEDEDVIMAYIGSGSLGVALYRGGNITFTQNILIGSLKLSEILGKLRDRTDKFYMIIDEYLGSFMYMLEKIIPSKKIKHFIVSGREIGIIKKFCDAEEKDGIAYISLENFNGFYEKIKNKSPEELHEKYDIYEGKSEILLASMGIYKALLKITKAEDIISPTGLLTDAILFSEFYPNEDLKLEKRMEDFTVESARSLADRFFYDKNHAEFVEEFSLKIFDRMKKVHGLGRRERLLLQLGAILHDIGKYINIKNHYTHSYTIIKASDILGINRQELEIIANIARYHSRKLPELRSGSYRNLKVKDKVLTSKLLAILRLADALDRSHGQKIQDIELRKQENEIIILITPKPYLNTLMDEWTFSKKSGFFKEVYGIKVTLKKRGGL